MKLLARIADAGAFVARISPSNKIPETVSG